MSSFHGGLTAAVYYGGGIAKRYSISQHQLRCAQQRAMLIYQCTTGPKRAWGLALVLTCRWIPHKVVSRYALLHVEEKRKSCARWST